MADWTLKMTWVTFHTNTRQRQILIPEFEVVVYN